MKKTTVAISFAAVLLLAACGRSGVDVEEELEDDSQLVIEIDLQDEDEEELLESPYQEVMDYFNEWQLPEEGRASLDDEYYEEYNPEQYTIYENGYVFDKQSKAMAAQIQLDEEEQVLPDEEQIPGVVMRYIADVADFGHIEIAHIEDSDTFQESLDFFYTGLNKIIDLNDFPPLNQWAQETTVAFETAEHEKDPDKRWEAFSNGLQRLDKMQWLVLN